MSDRNNLIKLIQEAEDEYMVYEMAEQALANRVFKSREEYIADYLIANGVIVPPCKVGQTVYYIAFGKVYKGKCHAITIHKDSLQIHLYDYDGDNASISAKDVFLTREEAEQKLKECEG